MLSAKLLSIVANWHSFVKSANTGVREYFVGKKSGMFAQLANYVCSVIGRKKENKKPCVFCENVL